MKYKKKLFWAGIVVVILVQILLYFMLVRPINAQADTLKPDLDKAVRILEGFDGQDTIVTEKTVKGLERNRETILAERNNMVKLLGEKDALSKPFPEETESGQEWAITQFKAHYKTELDKINAQLKAAGLLTPGPDQRISEGMENYSNDPRMEIQKKFNIQKTIAQAVLDSNVERFEALKIGDRAWMGYADQKYVGKKSPRALGEYRTGTELDEYYKVIPITLVVDVKFKELTRLMEKIQRQLITFRLFSMKVTKNEVTKITIPEGKTWEVTRDGQRKTTVPLPDGYEYKWDGQKPPVFPTVLIKMADFGSFPENREVVIPYSEEMLMEPASRVVLLYEVLDFDI